MQRFLEERRQRARGGKRRKKRRASLFEGRRDIYFINAAKLFIERMS